MVWVGTNTALANTNGNTGRNTADWAASGFATISPIVAITQDSA